MKKFLLAVLFCFSLTLSAFGLVACNQGNGGGESGQTEFQKVYSQYVINAQAAGETPLSYEEWLNTIKGEKGDPGENGVGIEKVELNADGNLVITFTDGSTQTVDMPVSGTQTPPLEEHDFGAWALYDFENFTCENGLFYRTCSDCNAVEWKKGTENDHDWADSYSSNNTYHWIACKNCGKRLNEEEHSFLNASCQACGKIRVSSSSSSKSSSSVVLYGVSLDKTEATLEVGQTLTLVATTNPANYNGTATWSSTNRDVAVVEDGVVTAIAEGTTTIKVKYGTGSSAKSATCLITVEKVAPCTSVSLNKSSVSLGVGGTETLVATTNPIDTTDTIVWFTYDASVATVANGIVTAVDVGSTTITVQCGDQMATCLITVGPTDGVLYEVVGDIARVVGYEGTATRVRLAETYENAPVTEIYANAFKGKLIASVIIPDSVTSIGEDAFRSCDNLTSVVIGDSVDSIGDSAFSWCSNLTSIEIPDSVTSISNYAFRSCYNLTSVVIGGGVETIYSYAFSDCTNLTDVYYQGTADDWARIWFFDNYSNPLYHAENFYINNELVTEINLTTVTNVFDCAFSGCDSLTSVVLGDGVTSIGYSAFENCSKLTSIEIPNGVEYIGRDAFSGCTNLTFNKHGNANYLPSKTNPYFALISVTNKNDSTYTIHQDTKIIAGSAFRDCDNLTDVYYQGTADDWAQIWFVDTYSNPLRYADNFYIQNELVTEINLTTATKVSNYAFYGCDSLTSVLIGDGVTSIGYSAFYNCSKLTSVEIPDRAERIGEDAFYGCTNLTFNKHGNANYLPSKTNPYFALISVTNKNDSTYTIHQDTKIIAGSAFRDCDNLTSIEIPDSVTSIGNYAFYDCANLTSVVIGDGVTSIGNSAFHYCSNLTSVEIGDGLESIGNGAFSNCINLTSIEIPDNVTSIGDYAFWYCTNLTFNKYGNANYLPSKTNPYFALISATNKNYSTYTIHQDVKIIASSAFYDINLTSVVIGDNVESIGEYAFWYCTNLTSVYYMGTESDWATVSIGSFNYDLISATWYYYIENQEDVPTDGGNYWHYENGVPTPW